MSAQYGTHGEEIADGLSVLYGMKIPVCPHTVFHVRLCVKGIFLRPLSTFPGSIDIKTEHRFEHTLVVAFKSMAHERP